jgi:hypothetical protein
MVGAGFSLAIGGVIGGLPRILGNSVAWGDVPTWGLLIGAGITAWYAKRAFDEQSKEVSTLQEQLKAQQELNEQQTPVLILQARDLTASLEQRERDDRERRIAQVSFVFTWESAGPHTQ